MPNLIQAACPKCGNVFQVEASGQKTAACTGCGENVRIVAHSSARMAAIRPEDAMDLASPIASGAYQGVRPEHAPKPEIDSEADYQEWLEQKMLAQARTALATKNAACTDWDGRKAFSALIELQHPKTLKQEAVNFTIAAMDGMLYIETIAAPLPKPPLTVLRDAVNRLNTCAGGTAFLLRTCGVVARYRLVPRMCIETGVNGDSVLRAVRQINFDRIQAGAFFQEEWLRSGLSKASAIEKAFAAPLAASVSSVISLQQLRALAEAGGYHALVKGDRLYIAAEASSADASVWMTVNGGVLRGWAAPGSLHESSQSSERWGVLSKLMGNKRAAAAVSRSQLDKLLDRINEMNETAGLLNYVWDGERVLGTAMFPPTEKRLELEEFQAFVEILVKRARDVAEKELSVA
ncbi:MAG: hypothetical protein KIS92_06525 [Planctomycetota bacterium]|nr:hypothetical protein [Planctomycetota bacterium]